MKGRMRPYLPELTIRDYNTYMRYLRGVRRQMYKSYGFYACHLLRTNGVLFAILSDSLAGRMPTCKRQRVPGTLFRRSMMCQTLGIRQAAQTEILMGWHNLQDRKYSELRPAKRVRRAVDKLLLRRAYETEYRPEFTDDASVVELSGEAVFLCEGERANLKITTPEDTVIAEALLADREETHETDGENI